MPREICRRRTPRRNVEAERASPRENRDGLKHSARAESVCSATRAAARPGPPTSIRRTRDDSEPARVSAVPRPPAAQPPPQALAQPRTAASARLPRLARRRIRRVGEAARSLSTSFATSIPTRKRERCHSRGLSIPEGDAEARQERPFAVARRNVVVVERQPHCNAVTTSRSDARRVVGLRRHAVRGGARRMTRPTSNPRRARRVRRRRRRAAAVIVALPAASSTRRDAALRRCARRRRSKIARAGHGRRHRRRAASSPDAPRAAAGARAAAAARRVVAARGRASASTRAPLRRRDCRLRDIRELNQGPRGAPWSMSSSSSSFILIHVVVVIGAHEARSTGILRVTVPSPPQARRVPLTRARDDALGSSSGADAAAGAGARRPPGAPSPSRASVPARRRAAAATDPTA